VAFALLLRDFRQRAQILLAELVGHNHGLTQILQQGAEELMKPVQGIGGFKEDGSKQGCLASLLLDPGNVHGNVLPSLPLMTRVGPRLWKRVSVGDQAVYS
jgi:hypothetical protein